MANPNFEVSTITTVGAALLAQATEGNKVIFSGCEANSTVYTLEQAKAVASITGTRITAGIEVTDVTDARILVRSTFEPSAATGGEANSLILFGRLSSQDENTRTPICVVSNSTSFYLPEYNQAAVTAFDCLFTVQYNVSSPVVVEQTSALECSLAEFRQLKERVVTTHKAGESTGGDDQDVYGVKTFWDGVKLKDSVYGDIQTATVDVDEFKIVNTEMNHGFEASYGQDIVISSNSGVSTNFKVQDETLTFGRYYGRSFFSLDCSGDSGTVFLGIAPDSSTGNFPISVVEGSLSEGVYLAADYAKLKKLSISEKISGTTRTESILPADDISHSLGSTDLRWLVVYSDTLKARTADLLGDLVVNGSITAHYLYPTEQAVNDIGSSTRQWSNVYTKNAIVSNTLKVTGEASFSSTVSVSGTLMTYGSINLNKQNLFFGTDDGTNYKLAYYNKGIDVYGHLSPGSNGIYNLGSSAYKWSNVFATSLSGSASAIAEALCPSTDSAYTISIGSALIIIVRSYRKAGAGETTVVRGTAMSSSSWSIFPGSFFASGIDSSTSYTMCFLHSNTSTALSGTYRLMSNLYFPKNSTSADSYYYSAALAVRIA